jgi:hypothetical protein
MTYYSDTVHLNASYFNYNVASNYAPFELTIDVSGIPNNPKVTSIQYLYSDGTNETINYQLYLDGSDSGNPINSPRKKVFTQAGVPFVVINVSTLNPNEKYQYKIFLNLSNPVLENSSNQYFNEIHLTKTRMFGPNNDIVYTFETQNKNYPLFSFVNWSLKPKPVISAKQLSRPYKMTLPFNSQFPNNTTISSIPYVFASGSKDNEYINGLTPTIPQDTNPPITTSPIG